MRFKNEIIIFYEFTFFDLFCLYKSFDETLCPGSSEF